MKDRNDRVELHCHLDGSVRPGTVAELAAQQGTPLARPVDELVVAPAECGSLTTYLGYIEPVLDVLQTPDALHRAARELVHDWHADGVGYGEVRFAPQLHGRHGMSMDEAVDAVVAGLAAGRAETGAGADAGAGVRTGLLLCCLRHQSPDISERVVDTALRHRDVVSGVDLAGDESHSGQPHREAFAAAHAGGLGVTIHAGEAAGPASVWEALDVLGAARIGHGVRAVQERALLDRLRSDGVSLEMCPVSNVQTGAVASLADHPADRLLADGFAVTISTDARTTSQTTLEREFQVLAGQFGWTSEHEDRCQHHARAAAFGQI
ncbi:adenosine deaminase [Actinobacteria bacterium YIM 96077]|uniref:adenosine deaminase n=1 Tax=Phytoactinopolyspora halophila TaxID=1981511 RepID=A0A329QZF7_9ACTN|nr:adenosine deaminase [Phytoactinopolyspora halophila]AYY13152.1 adenosine deaminase [Actinobacteria bacterium YIM 96077]RAW17607.1 adenosine deaminase [Phytoactinopolyspora halophila]